MLEENTDQVIKESLQVQINSPDELIWLGRASAVSSKNSQGDFDILPQHANFITIVKKNPVIIHLLLSGEKKFDFQSALIYMHNNKVRIYANI